MSHSHQYGKPENVLSYSDKKIIIDEEAMRKMFEHPQLKNRKIVAFSIIGAYRKGKSFFLDYCLRFLYANYPSINYLENPTSDKENWMGDENEPLSGFTWRSGPNRDTTGIVMWNDIFLHTMETTGDNIAIVIMDTQGLFDNETSPMENSRIFALGTLCSSIQVLNLSGVIQEDQLQYLQFATEFAKFAASDSHGAAGKPFQKLLFLFRDWDYEGEYPFGFEGGSTYLQHFLKVQNEQKPELKSVRNFIKCSFEELSCALLPHPGKTVTRTSKKNTKYNGSWGGMDEEFKDELFAVIENLLKPEKLILKKIHDKELTNKEYVEFTLQYFKIFQSDKIPEAQSIYESTVEKQNNLIVDSCIDAYKEAIYKNVDLLTSTTQIPILHNMSKSNALLKYKDSKKMGNLAHETKFMALLSEKIEKLFQEWSDRSKNNIAKINEEMEKTRIAIEEKQKFELQQKENESKAAQQIRELQELLSQTRIDVESYKQEMENAKTKLNNSISNNLQLQAEKEAEIKFSKLLEEKLQDEKNQREYSRGRSGGGGGGGCTLL